MKDVIQNYQKEKISIDAIWADETMNTNYKTFTVNNDKFAGLKDFVKQLHSDTEGIDMRFVAIANPGIKVETGYKYYDKALEKKVYIESAANFAQPFTGRTAAG